MTEIRSVSSDLQAITRDDTNQKVIQGYAILFNEQSIDLGGFTEVIESKALDGVDLSDVKLVYAHENNSILARASAKNLQTNVDDKGLFFVATLPNTTRSNDVYEDIKAGNLKGMSFCFTIPQGGDEWTRQKDGTLLHTVNQIGAISELTITAYPAYQKTSVELLRSAENIQKGNTNVSKEDIKRDSATDANTPDTEAENTEATESDTPSVEDLVAQMQAIQEALAEITQGADEDDSSDDDGNDSSAEDDSEDDEAGTDNEDGADADSEDEKDAPVERDDGDDLDRSAEQTNGTEQKRSAENTKDNKEMAQIITRDNLSEEEQIKRSYVETLAGNKRDGITTDAEGAILVPKQVLDIQKTPNDATSLGHYINRMSVSAPTGTLPVLAKAQGRLVTKAELAKNPEVGKQSITGVDYKVQTYVGQLPLSLEAIQDMPNAESLVAQYLQDVNANTEESAIGAILSTKFGSNTAKSLDDLKSAFNKLVNYGSDRVIVMSTSAFDAIDRLKDTEGHYYIQPSVVSASGSSLFGAQIVITADETLGKAGDANVFVGSLKHAVVEAVRLDGLATSWAQNDYFEQILSVASRFDVQAADTDAGAFYKFDATAAQASAGNQG